MEPTTPPRLPPAVAAAAELGAADPRILIIEDYRSARESLSRLFRRNGWDSVQAADAYEAHQYIHSSVRNPPDVYLVDLKLPGHPGAQIIRIIRLADIRSPATGLPVRVVVYTSFDADDPQVAEAVAAGADAVVLKLWDFDDILAVVRGDHGGILPLIPRPAPAPRPLADPARPPAPRMLEP